MEEMPQRAKMAKRLGSDAIREIVPNHDAQADQKVRPYVQVDESGHHDHRDSDSPDDL
jgi:hypothetical protein